jgi:hypothetical protein
MKKVPLIENFLDHVFTRSQLKPDWPLIRDTTVIAFDLHGHPTLACSGFFIHSSLPHYAPRLTTLGVPARGKNAVFRRLAIALDARGPLTT